jgi:hypothetical protein
MGDHLIRRRRTGFITLALLSGLVLAFGERGASAQTAPTCQGGGCGWFVWDCGCQGASFDEFFGGSGDTCAGGICVQSEGNLRGSGAEGGCSSSLVLTVRARTRGAATNCAGRDSTSCAGEGFKVFKYTLDANCQIAGGGNVVASGTCGGVSTVNLQPGFGYKVQVDGPATCPACTQDSDCATLPGGSGGVCVGGQCTLNTMYDCASTASATATSGAADMCMAATPTSGAADICI